MKHKIRKSKKASDPFRFYTRLHLQELTGIKARSLRELCNILEEVPGSVVYHHTHRYLQQHQYLSPEPPNDFAYWVDNAIGEKELAEQLASIDTMRFNTIRLLREELIATIKKHLEKHKRSRRALVGGEFHFIKSISFILPTPHVAWTLEDFAQALKKITIRSLYFHIFEARLRLEKGKNDFSNWIEGNIGDTNLAKEIDKLDPYTHTMEGLRESLVNLIQARLKK